MKLTNRYNRFIYRLWSPIYDRLVGGLFLKGRMRAIEVVGLSSADHICLIGVGTGADLDLIPKGASALGIDISDAMLRRARQRLPISGCDIRLVNGDASRLPSEVSGSSFDVVVLNLILSVVPDPSRCMDEALRILKPEGRIVVFDKFLRSNGKPSWKRQIANIFSTLFGTDINRRFLDIVANKPCRVIHDEPSLLNGLYRVILLRKTGDAPKMSDGAL